MTLQQMGVLWMFVAAVGAGMSVYNAWDALQDLRALGVASNGRTMIARANLRAQVVRAVQMMVWVVPGSVVAFELLPASQRRGALVVWCLMAGMSLATANSTLDRVVKRRLLHGYVSRPDLVVPDDGDDPAGGSGGVTDV